MTPPRSLFIAICAAAATASAAQQPAAQAPASPTPRSTTAVTYEARGTTEIDLVGTPLQPRARGAAEIKTEAAGPVRIKARVRGMGPAGEIGAEYLTYVLWAIPPRGRAKNLGELRLDDGAAEIEATSNVQTFALVVTAEPYYAVTTPGNVVVLENAVREQTRGRTSVAAMQYEFVPRGAYVAGGQYALPPPGHREPPDVQQARNAVAIAQIAQAGRLAPEGMATAQRLLSQVEQLVAARKSSRDIVSQARAAVQAAEEARLQAVGRRLAADAERERQRAEHARGEADAARAASQAQAAHADALPRKAEQDRAAVRETLRRQFNEILETRDTARGLIVNVGDVLFETGRYVLKPPAREKLARFAGIVLAHVGLDVQVEGFTDSTGTDPINERLSQQRAGAVAHFVVAQGLSRDRVTTRGYGAAHPIASNDTTEGRQKNRRVELVVSGDVIGTPIGSAHR